MHCLASLLSWAVMTTVLCPAVTVGLIFMDPKAEIVSGDKGQRCVEILDDCMAVTGG